jgi:hypothetical protein
MNRSIITIKVIISSWIIMILEKLKKKTIMLIKIFMKFSILLIKINMQISFYKPTVNIMTAGIIKTNKTILAQYQTLKNNLKNSSLNFVNNSQYQTIIQIKINPKNHDSLHIVNLNFHQIWNHVYQNNVNHIRQKNKIYLLYRNNLKMIMKLKIETIKTFIHVNRIQILII